MATGVRSVPEHVPAELVVDYDPVGGAWIKDFPPSAFDGLREDYRVFWTTYGPGSWVLTRHADIRAAYEDDELFAQSGTITAGTFMPLMIPLTLNAPEHKAWRRVLQPLFTPGRVRTLGESIRETARERLADIGPRGACDVATEFAIALPAAMFCNLLGLPRENFTSFNRLAFDLVYTPDVIRAREGHDAAQAFRAARNEEIETLVGDLVPLRREQPGDDLISYLLAGRYEDRPLTVDEIVNISTLMFFAGTDSTGAMITYSLMFLARNPEYRQRLVDDPGDISKAADELIRYHGFHTLGRDVMRDVEFAGVRMKRGDRVWLPTGGGNHDPRAYERAQEVDFDRRAPGMLTFGAGPHRCLGAPLATLEVKIALEEFLAVIPDFRLDPDKEVEYAFSAPKAIPAHVALLYPPTR
jgi:cytochrome P450